MNTPAIHIQSAYKTYGRFTALNHVSFSVAQGEFFALLGPNGAGKTTLISAMAGLNRLTTGSIHIMGHDVQKDYRLSRKALGVVPQELVYDPFFTVRETLRIQSGYFGLRHNDAWVDEILHHLGLSDKANSNMRTLSGGMKRRVMVAQALVHRPPVIVLDEPTAGVDVDLRQSLWAFIQRLNQEGHTILLTTHYLEEAETLCNRIAMLKQGQLVALDTKESLLSHASERCLRIKTAQALPAQLQSLLVSSGEQGYRLRIGQLNEVAPILAAFNAHDALITELEIEKPDLESVFMHYMQDQETSI